MRCVLVVVLALALCAPASASASAQAPPADLWESAPAAGGAPGSGGRDTVLFVLALVVFAGAGGTAVLALRTPRLVTRVVAVRAPVVERAPEPESEPVVRRPRVAGPPPLPAFGPGSHAGPSAAPPPPD
jgi:hypothetical protein